MKEPMIFIISFNWEMCFIDKKEYFINTQV